MMIWALGRILLWRMALNGIISHPLLGYGPSNYFYGTYAEQLDLVSKYYKKSDRVENKAHNEYLEIAVTMGIPALLIYLLAVFLIMKKDLSNIFKNKISFILVLSIGAYLIQAFFSISVIHVAPIFWFILGISNNEKFKNNITKDFE